MLRRPAPLLAATLLLVLGHGAARATEAPEVAIAVVQGVAEGDLLNLRAAASPVSKIETRLPNGASLKKFGCEVVNGYEWCEVQDTDNPDMRGWVPSRYLRDASPAEIAAASATMATGATQQQVPPAREGGDGKDGRMTAREAAGATPAGDGGRIAPPPDLAARLGGPPAASEADEKSAAALRKAMQDAYGLAFAGAAPAAGEDEAAQDEKVASAGAVDDDTAGEDAAAAPEPADVPVPTPRPELDEALPRAAVPDAEAGADPVAPQPAPAVVAQAQAPAPAAAAAPAAPPDATGEIPCARYVGQPMTHCAAAVVRRGADAADVTVTWPDGGTRIITFRDGKPAGSNSRGEFRFTREGTLNMIRIGLSERFEITDALPFGD